MSFEGEKNLDIEFNDIIPCHRREGRNGHTLGPAETDWLIGDAIWSGHSFRKMGSLSADELLVTGAGGDVELC